MRHNYLIFSNLQLVSSNPDLQPIKIKGKVKLYFNKDNTIDRRTKGYGDLMKKRTQGHDLLKGDVDIKML